MGQTPTPTASTVATETCGSGRTFRNFIRSSISSEENKEIILSLSRRFSSETTTLSDIPGFEHEVRRNLQAECDFLYILKIAIVFDNTFCQDHGGESQSEAVIRKIISEVSKVYESTICLTFQINYLVGFCDDSANAFSGLKDITNPEERLREFKFAFDANADLAPGEKGLAYLFSGTCADLSGDVAGAAFSRVLCRLPRDGYGILVYSGITATNCKQGMTLILHEIGHNVGGFTGHPYGASGELIMSDTFCNGCTSFSEVERIDLEKGLFRVDQPEILCVQETTEDPTLPPTTPPLRVTSPPISELPVPIPDAPPFIIQPPTSGPTFSPTAKTLFPTTLLIPEPRSTGQFPIALPSALGSGALGGALWYLKKRRGK